MYKPPFDITNKMLALTMSIAEKTSKIDSYQLLKSMPILRKNNRIQSIHSSLIIENNSLSYAQVRDVISGKSVIGPKNEIQEVKNAYKAYEMMDEFDCYSESDLLKANGVITSGLVDNAGEYRKHPEGVFDGKRVIFVAPPEDMVPKLMNDLFSWLKNDNETPLLIKSCVFHYEFVFIHPFSDGNGRTARLWQNVILSKWNKIFEYMPIETQILKYQSSYYDVIDRCNNKGNSTMFVEYMLEMIDETLKELYETIEKEKNNISFSVSKLLNVMEYGIPYSANELMERLNIKSKETLRGSYLNPAIENGLIKMTIPDKPNSKNQKYIK